MKDKKINCAAAILVIFICGWIVTAQAAPCYGTRMPEKKKLFSGIETHTIFKRYLKDNYGKLRSTQYFLLLSYGLYDWLSIDLKGGAGNIRQHPVGSDELDYPSSFAGGYGFRLRFYNQNNIKAVLGFQHISVHPRSIDIGNTKHKAVLDDWQVSLLASYDFKKFTPYLGTKCSRVDYIHWKDTDRKRQMSDLTKTMGLVVGSDFNITPKLWLNLEGQFFDGEALAVSLNTSF